MVDEIRIIADGNERAEEREKGSLRRIVIRGHGERYGTTSPFEIAKLLKKGTKHGEREQKLAEAMARVGR